MVVVDLAGHLVVNINKSKGVVNDQAFDSLGCSFLATSSINTDREI